jgi:hypothetical protein
MEEMRNAYKFWSGRLNRRDNLEYQGLDGIVILKWILTNMVAKCELDSFGSDGGLL